MENRQKRKVVQGVVTSDKMEKTIVVTVKTYRMHPLYGKRVRYTKKFKAHDENRLAKVGDTVEIMETRPLSATKHFRLVRVVEANKDKTLGSETI